MKRALAGGASAVIASAAVATTARPALAHHTPDEYDVGAVEIGFCTDMAAHHMQAIEMCERVLGRDTGGAVQSAATEVLRNQAIEIGMMRAWLADWGASTAPPLMVMGWVSTMHSASDADDTAPDHTDTEHVGVAQDMGCNMDTDMEPVGAAQEMGGDMDTDMEPGGVAQEMGGDMDTDMEHGMPLADMPGYATPTQLLALSQAAPGVPKGRMWLELMRAHHVGGVSMADAAAELATSQKVIRLAQTQSAVQTWEIGQYDFLLSTTYA